MTSARLSPTSSSPDIRDEERLEALRRYDVLDTEPEPAIDRITRLAAHLFEVPKALVNFVAEDRQWFKSTVGIDEKETGLEMAFCVYTVEKGDVLAVENLAEDERFAHNPYVTERGLRFYAGAPLVTPGGKRLGTICVLDTEPRSPSEEVLARLSDLAKMVMDELELRRKQAEHREARAELEQSRELLRHAQQLAEVGGWTYDPQSDTLTWTDQTYRIHDLPTDEEIGVEQAIDFYTEESQPVIQSHVERLIEEGGTYDLELDVVTAKGKRRRVRTIGEAYRSNGETVRIDGAIQDITERHRARQDLAEQKEMFQTVFENVPVMLAQREGENVNVVNRRFEEVTGWTQEEVKEHPAILEEFYPDPAVREEARNAIDEAPDEWRDFPLRTKDGRIVDTTWKGRYLTDGTFLGIGLDITERKERERRLEQLETLFQNAQDPFFLVDVKGEQEKTFSIRRVNPAYEAALEITEEELRDTRLPEVYGAAGRRMEAHYRECVEERAPLEYEEYAVLDGERTYWQTRIAPVIIDGEVDQIVGTTRNITQQKRRKQKLKRQNDLFAKAQDIANVGAWEYNVRSGETVVTEQTYHIHGMEPGADIGPEQTIDLFHTDDQSTLQDAFKRAIKEGKPYDLELRLITADGEQKWIRTRGEPQREDGEIVRVRGTIQDITESVHRIHELEEAKEAAEEADRIKTALLSNINHEFRTPLTSIISFSELIRDNPEVAGQFADRILGGGKRLLYTLNTVMDFAELESGGRSVTPKPVHLRQIVRSVVNDFRAQARRKGLDLSVELAEDGRTVLLDEHRVERILTHLVHNAVKFTDEGEVAVSARRENGVVELTVEDSGVGIAPDFQPHVFDEFAQQSSGFDRTHEGNGLGLTVVKRLVEEMNGAIDLESTPGAGTQVVVRLPEEE